MRRWAGLVVAVALGLAGGARAVELTGDPARAPALGAGFDLLRGEARERALSRVEASVRACAEVSVRVVPLTTQAAFMRARQQDPGLFARALAAEGGPGEGAPRLREPYVGGLMIDPSRLYWAIEGTAVLARETVYGAALDPAAEAALRSGEAGFVARFGTDYVSARTLGRRVTIFYDADMGVVGGEDRTRLSALLARLAAGQEAPAEPAEDVQRMIELRAKMVVRGALIDGEPAPELAEAVAPAGADLVCQDLVYATHLVADELARATTATAACIAYELSPYPGLVANTREPREALLRAVGVRASRATVEVAACGTDLEISRLPETDRAVRLRARALRCGYLDALAERTRRYLGALGPGAQALRDAESDLEAMLSVQLGSVTGEAEPARAPLSSDEAHRLYQAAESTGDASIYQEMQARLGLVKADGQPNEQHRARFMTLHAAWKKQNSQFVKEMSEKERALEYVRAHE